MTAQGYVSDKLTHLTSLSALTEILESRRIGIPISEREAVFEGLPPGVVMHPDWKPLRRDEFFRGDMVSFCDIPEKELSIHSGKYGDCGIAFYKARLASRGANPVFYVDQQSLAFFESAPWKQMPRPPEQPMPDMGGVTGRWEGITRMLPELKANLHPQLDIPGLEAREREQIRIREALFRLLESNVLGFLKPFDSALPDEHRENYYMEREWRLIGPADFNEDEVAWVYAPRQDIANLIGKFLFLEGRVGALPEPPMRVSHER